MITLIFNRYESMGYFSPCEILRAIRYAEDFSNKFGVIDVKLTQDGKGISFTSYKDVKRSYLALCCTHACRFLATDAEERFVNNDYLQNLLEASIGLIQLLLNGKDLYLIRQHLMKVKHPGDRRIILNLYGSRHGTGLTMEGWNSSSFVGKWNEYRYAELLDRRIKYVLGSC